MSDTIQIVRWALAQACPLRTGEKWRDPSEALKALAYEQSYSEVLLQAARDCGVFDGICVTENQPTHAKGEQSFNMPRNGFSVAQRLNRLGSVENLHRLCGGCPANTTPAALAGCAGFIYPISEEKLGQMINQLELRNEMSGVFPSTKPSWYGLWLQSPIPPTGLNPLRRLLVAIFDEATATHRATDWQLISLRRFLDALDRATTHQLDLHVSLAPPGHMDLGWHTIFPHCPKCKAEAPVERWKRRYSETKITCRVCGHSYAPAETYTATRMDNEDEKSKLLNVMGAEAYREFVLKRFIAQGATNEQAERVLAVEEETQRQRVAKRAKVMEEGRIKRAYVETVLFAGLKNSYRRFPDDDEEKNNGLGIHCRGFCHHS